MTEQEKFSTKMNYIALIILFLSFIICAIIIPKFNKPSYTTEEKDKINSGFYHWD